jgi:hypothetical protein
MKVFCGMVCFCEAAIEAFHRLKLLQQGEKQKEKK